MTTEYNVEHGRLGSSALSKSVELDEAPLSHPADPDGLALLDYNWHGPVTAGEAEHALVGLAVLFHVVLYEIYPAPLQILAGGGAERTTRRDVELYRSSHAFSHSQPTSPKRSYLKSLRDTRMSMAHGRDVDNFGRTMNADPHPGPTAHCDDVEPCDTIDE